MHRSKPYDACRRILGTPTALLLVLNALAISGSLLWASAPPNHDTSWWLYITDRMLDGAVFGRDVIETNPPLFFAITFVPVALSRLFDADAYTLFCVWVGLIIAASAFVSRGPLQDLGLSATRAQLCAAGLVVGESLVVGRHYGQREAVLIALVLPFVLIEAARLARDVAPSRRKLIAAAAVASLGFLVKPFFATVPAGLALWRAFRQRNLMTFFATEYLVMLLIAFIYATSVFLFAPHWIALLPDISSAYPAGFNSVDRLLRIFAGEAVLFGGVAVCAWIVGGSIRRTAFVSLGIAGLFYLGTALQLRGFDYQFVPGRILLWLALLIILVAPEHVSSASRNTAKAVAAAMALFLLANGSNGAGFLHRGRVQHDELAIAVRRAGARPFLAISPLLQGVFPQVTELRANWASRSAHQWIALGANAKLRSRDPAVRAEGERLRTRAAQMLSEELAERRPAVIAVARAQGSYGLGVDWLSFLRADSSFNQAWSGYCLVQSTQSWDIFEPCSGAEAPPPAGSPTQDHRHHH